MSLALGIVGIVYVAAMVVLGGLCRGALRQAPSSTESRASSTNIIPFRSAPARSAGSEAAKG